MDILYENKTYKLCLFNRNTTIISTNSSDKDFITTELQKKGVNVVNVSNEFSADSVLKELDIFSVDEKTRNHFNIERIINKSTLELSIEQIALLKIVVEIAKKPSSIVLNDCLTYLKNDDKNKVLMYLKLNNITLINITSNEEEFLYCGYMIVINDNCVAVEGLTSEVLQKEILLKRMGFNLPFSIDLSLQLKAYNIIDNLYLDYKELVSDLWKI